jgi:hypothetical protein
MNIITKWLTVPVSNEVREIEVAQLWEVRWTSRNGAYHSDTQPEMEAFPTQQEAAEFAEALRNAFFLLRHKGSGTDVTLRKAGSGVVRQLISRVG